MLETILGYASVVLIVLSAFFTWRIYQVSKSRDMLWLFGAFIYLSVVRLAIVLWEPPSRNLMLIPFYIILTIGMWLFLRLIKKYINHPTSKGFVNKVKRWFGLK
jgi:O-antigen/teichoic acid export membrane protein